MSSEKIKNKALDFVKYHNGFVIGLMLALFGGAAIFAADSETRETVLGKEIISQTGVDNTAILAADLDDFDFGIKINDVTEDENNYYVDYSFQTLEIQDNIWQAAQRRASMAIDKLSLAGKDLGLYVQEQLTQIAQNEQNYLKQVQAAETKKGPTQIARATEYTGLIGLVLDVKNAILPGYDPVVKPAPVELTVTPPAAPEEIADEENNNLLANDNSSVINDSANQPSNTGSGIGGRGNDNSLAISNSDNQPPSSNGTTTEETIIPTPEPTETSETSEPPATESTDPDSSEPPATDPSEPESEPTEPEPAVEPEPDPEPAVEPEPDPEPAVEN